MSFWFINSYSQEYYYWSADKKHELIVDSLNIILKLEKGANKQLFKSNVENTRKLGK